MSETIILAGLAAIRLALAVVLLCELLPAGWMPDFGSATTFTICTVDGLGHHSEQQLPGKPVPADGRHVHDECPLAAVPHVAASILGDALVMLFVSFTTSYEARLFSQALDILSFYLAVLLGLSFYLRDPIGLRTWQLLHRYFIPAVYMLVGVWRTFLYGSNVQARSGLWIAVWVLQVPILAALVWRLRRVAS